jgi:peptidoglycan hydrolase-like protein with peptidoglycan-binding domain
MKRLLLASAACLALSFPAMAQGNQNVMSSHQQTTVPSSETNKQARSQPDSQQAASNQARTIEPSSLNKEEIRQIQLGLNKAGYSSGNVDGVWGSETSQALRNYQQTKQFPGDGQLNQQTLAALGVNTNSRSHSKRIDQNDEQTEHQTTGSTAGNGMKSSASGKRDMDTQLHQQTGNASSQNQK